MEEWYEVINNSEYRKVKRMIHHYNDLLDMIFKIGDKQLNALQTAVANHDLKMVDLLIEEGVNTEYEMPDGNTMLMFAVAYNDYEIAKKLLMAGANTKHLDNAGNDIYQHARNNPDIKMLDMLYKYNKDVSVPNNRGYTPLDYILRIEYYFDKYDITIWYLEHGSDIKYILKNDPMIVAYMYYTNQNKLLKYLILNYESFRNHKDDYGNTISHNAVSYENEEILKFIIDNGFFKNEPNLEGITPIEYAHEDYQTMLPILEKYNLD